MVSQTKTLVAVLATSVALVTAPVSAQDDDIAVCEDLRREVSHLSDMYHRGGHKQQMAVWKKLRVDAIGRFKYLQCSNVLVAQNDSKPGNSPVQDETVREILAAMESGDDLSEVLPATAAGAPGDSAAEASAAGTLAQRVEAQRQDVIQRTGRAPSSQGWGQGF